MLDQMQKAGATREEIWNATTKIGEGSPYIGAHSGVDKIGRFEIDDSRAGALPSPGVTLAGKSEHSVPIGERIIHPEYMNAYPDAAGMNVQPMSGKMKDGTSGIYYEGKGFPYDASAPDRGRSIALHELQHDAQFREGFARGGNPNTFWTDKRSLMGQKEAQEKYIKLAGETEARTVQKRADLTPEQRAARPPWLDYDVPEGQQIVRFGNDGPSMSLDTDIARQIHEAQRAANPAADPNRLAQIAKKGDRWDVLSPVGNIVARDTPQGMQIKAADLDVGVHSGLGYGMPLYEKLAKEASAAGKNLVSDSVVSQLAQNVYGGLSRRGYDVYGPPANALRHPDSGALIANEPIYNVSAPNVAPREMPPPLPDILYGNGQSASAPGVVIAEASRRGPTTMAKLPELQRPFSFDYPTRTGSPGANLTRTIDGAVMNPKAKIVGRQTVGGPDVPLSYEDQLLLMKELGVPIRHMGPEFKAQGYDAYYMPPSQHLSIRYDPRYEEHIGLDLTNPDLPNALPHEVGHALDNRAGGVKMSPDAKTEAGGIYSWHHKDKRGHVTPSLYGYEGAQIGRELTAEALRGYMQAPGTFKDVAPSAAKAIRSAINAHPELSRFIQFNANTAEASAPGLLAAEAADKTHVRSSLGFSGPSASELANMTQALGVEMRNLRTDLGNNVMSLLHKYGYDYNSAVRNTNEWLRISPTHPDFIADKRALEAPGVKEKAITFAEARKKDAALEKQIDDASRGDRIAQAYGSARPLDEQMKVYHGTDAQFKSYDSEVARSKSAASKDVGSDVAFVTPNQTFAQQFGDNVRELNLHAGKYFDPWNDIDLAAMAPFINSRTDAKQLWNKLDPSGAKQQNWGVLENKSFIDELRRRGYDGVRMAENYYDTSDVKRTAPSVAVFTRGKLTDANTGEVFFSHNQNASLPGAVIAEAADKPRGSDDALIQILQRYGLTR